MLPVETKRQRVNMISAISSQGKVRFMVYQDTMNQQRLIRFMQRLVRASEQKVFLILDNLKVHHGKLAGLCQVKCVINFQRLRCQSRINIFRIS